MCIMNVIQIFTYRCYFTHFLRKSKRAPPICMHPEGATNVCVNMYYMMHMTRESQQRREEGQRTENALPAKTRPSDFINQIL
jgi:heme/copper-type cytochrome/quinol oxidase subunit 4